MRLFFPLNVSIAVGPGLFYYRSKEFALAFVFSDKPPSMDLQIYLNIIVGYEGKALLTVVKLSKLVPLWRASPEAFFVIS